MAGSRGNRQTMSEDTNPVFHGFTLKVSIALATVGDEMRESSASTWGSCAVMRPPLSPWGLLGSRRTWSSDGLLAAPAKDLPYLVQGGLDLGQGWVHGKSLLEVLRGLGEVVLLQVDEPETRQRSEVDRVALHHFLAVGQRAVEVTHEVVGGRPLVPALREAGRAGDHLGEDRDRLGQGARLHQSDPLGQERVDRRVARAVPDRPQGIVRFAANGGVGIVERLDERGGRPVVA